jgi:hypothetical protein
MLSLLALLEQLLALLLSLLSLLEQLLAQPLAQALLKP